MKRIGAAAAMVALVMVASACGGKGSSDAQAGHEAHAVAAHAVTHTASGDVQELVKAGELPGFLSGKSKEITATYKLAEQNEDLLKWIPCFCGCGESAGHKSNLECFIKERKADGSVVWDDHGTKCDICLTIAQIATGLAKQGKTPKEIRSFIEQKFGSGYGEPTPTPVPSA